MSYLYTNQHIHSGPYNTVRIHGLQNSGTNLLTLYIKRHFSVNLDIPGWKHQMLNPAFCHQFPGFVDPNVLKIFVIKDPVFWLQSMFKSPYELMSTGRVKSINDYIRHPIQLTRERGGNVYRNPVSYWHKWYERGLYWMDQYKMPLIMIRYEDLLFHPELVINELAGYLTKLNDWTQPSIIEESAKTHGASRNRNEALIYYQNLDNRWTGINEPTIRFIWKEL